MDPIELVHQLNDLYTNAFNQLIIITSLMIGFGGFILPILLQVLQTKSIKIEREALETKIIELTNKQKTELNSEVNHLFEKEKNEIRDFMDCESAKSQGLSYAVQGGVYLQNHNYRDATASYLDAVLCLLKGKDENNLWAAFDDLAIAMPKLTPDDLDEEINIEFKTVSLIEILKKKDENGRYSRNIETLKKTLNKIKKKNTVISKE